MKKFALLGYPIKHSLSPLLHNTAFKELNIDANYKLYEILPENFEKEVKKLLKELDGFNITIPFKERILNFLDVIDGEAQKIGASNCACKKNGKWHGYNTDAIGFIKALKEDINPKNLTVFVVGCGGAAKAVSFALAKNNVKKIFLKDIDTQKAGKLKKRIEKFYPQIPVFVAEDFSGIKNSQILINATPVGMKEGEMPVPAEFLHKDLYVFDLIYKKTPLLKEAQKRGLKFQDGLKMLIGQAQESFRIWTGVEPAFEIMLEAVNPVK